MTSDSGHGVSHIIAGTGFDGRDEIIREHCRDGARLRFKREPSNPYDEYAVAVWMETPGFFGTRWKEIGFVKASRNKKLARKLDAGEEIIGRVKNFYAPPERDFPRVTIEVFY